MKLIVIWCGAFAVLSIALLFVGEKAMAALRKLA